LYGAAVLVLLLLLLAAVVPATTRAGLAPGDSRAEPVPLGKEGAAGPLRIAVAAVVTGEEANARVAAVGPTNEQPRDGVGYVLVELRVRNAGERAVALDGGDFALSGASGLVRRFLGVEPPAPALGGIVEPGEEVGGWVAFAAPPDETDLLLLFDSLSLPGAWADRVFALEEGAAVPDASAPAAAPNDAGADAAAAAGLNAPVVTADWEVELLQVATGAEVFELVDYRTGALGLADAIGEDADGGVWVALRLRVTNVRGGDEPAFLPPNAFALVDDGGRPLPDVLALTPPRPDASGAYFPGASRDGWVAFDVAPAYAAETVRFLPYATDPDPRYLTYS
jgi:hypothetical protein